MLTYDPSKFSPQAAIPVFVGHPTIHVPPLHPGDLSMEDEEYAYDLRIVDQSNHVWQGTFVQRDVVEMGFRSFSQTLDQAGRETVFVLFLQGLNSQSPAPSPYDRPVGLKRPWDIIVARENFVIANTCVYIFPFDQQAGAEAVGDFVNNLLNYLQHLTTEKLVQQIEKWINATTPLRKHWNTPNRKNPELIMDYSLPFKAGANHFFRMQLPDDSGGFKEDTLKDALRAEVMETSFGVRSNFHPKVLAALQHMFATVGGAVPSFHTTRNMYPVEYKFNQGSRQMPMIPTPN